MKRTERFPARERVFSLPRQALPEEFVKEQIGIATRRSPNHYASGEAFAKPGTVVDPIAAEAYIRVMLSMNPNNIDPHMFLGSYELEKEALSMTARLLGKQDEDSTGDGFFLSGGTESINQAIWTYRNLYFAKRGLDIGSIGIVGAADELRREGDAMPVIIAPLDAHFAFAKAADLLGLGKDSVRYYNLASDYTTDYDDLERVVRRVHMENRDILLNVVVAGDTQKGRIQDVAAIADIVEQASAASGRETPPILVDAAAQYLFASVMRESPAYTGDMPDWDFRVPAVRAIVADPHKNQIPYSTGMLLLRTLADTKCTDSAGIYLSKDLIAGVDSITPAEREAAQHNATIPTSRGGYGAAATWAYYAAYGLEGIRARKEAVWQNVTRIANGIRDSEHYELICEPQTQVVSFKLREGDAADHTTVYEAINENPQDHLYISKSTALQARTREELAAAMGADSPYTGLYVHVMEHNTLDAVGLLLDRLEEEAEALRVPSRCRMP